MPRYSDEDLERILARTDGRCHICYEPLRLKDYGSQWEIDHSKPRAQGGTDHLNNLYPACISCNRQKRHQTSRSARQRHGRKRPPISRTQKVNIKQGQATGGAFLGAALGFLIGGGVQGAIIAGGIGAGIGWFHDPDEADD